VSLDQRLLAVIQAIYDAAVDETRWPGALKELSEFTDSQAATFWVLDGSEEPRLPTFSYVNLDPAFIQEYLDRVTPMDPWNRYLVGHPNQSIVHDGLVITEREKDHHPYFDWHGRYSDTRFRLIGQVCPAPAVHAGVALHRTRKAGKYESQDIEQFAALYSHLERALTIGFRLSSLGAMQQCATELLDRNPAAILLLDERKRIVYANRSAEALRSNGDGIRLCADGLTLERRQENDRLQGLIARALSPIASSGDSPGGVMRAPRPSGKRPYGLLVVAVSRQYPALSVLRPAVCIMISDPEKQKPLPSSRLQAAFGLTEAEARLAALLAAGEELRSAAEKLGITYGTARTRLAEIFQKTETRRQGELIKLLLTTLAMA
jgi:DNA-binding CsgD family transcriptional regulator/PAS domain-containing protein